MSTALQAVQTMAYTTLEDRQENFPCGLGSGTIPACLVNGQVLHLAASQGKVPAVSRLFLCFGRVVTSKSLRIFFSIFGLSTGSLGLQNRARDFWIFFVFKTWILIERIFREKALKKDKEIGQRRRVRFLAQTKCRRERERERSKGKE